MRMRERKKHLGTSIGQILADIGRIEKISPDEEVFFFDQWKLRGVFEARQEILTLYYDYSQGSGNGRIPEGRAISSFTLDPHWSKRPMPPKDKWGHAASDAELGLVPAASVAAA